MTDATTPYAKDRAARADDPTDHAWRDWKAIARRTKGRIAEENLGLVAAGVAFYGLLALFPGLAALVALGGLVSDPGAVADQIAPLVSVLPEAAGEIIMGQVNEVASGSDGGLGLAAIVGLLLALYSASKGVSNLMTGLNIAFDEDEDRGFVMVALTALLLTLFVLAVGMVALALVAVLPAIGAVFAGVPLWESIVDFVRWPALVVLGVLLFAVLYRYGPSRENARWRWLAPGSVVACTLWVVGTVAFTVYVQNFGNYNETFGALGGVIILLTWLWLSAFVVLIGAMIDAEIEAQTVGDTTTGAARPVGARGAEKADETPALPNT